jgi:hypothetical protein
VSARANVELTGKQPGAPTDNGAISPVRRELVSAHADAELTGKQPGATTVSGAISLAGLVPNEGEPSVRMTSLDALLTVVLESSHFPPPLPFLSLGARLVLLRGGFVSEHSCAPCSDDKHLLQL